MKKKLLLIPLLTGLICTGCATTLVRVVATEHIDKVYPACRGDIWMLQGYYEHDISLGSCIGYPVVALDLVVSGVADTVFLPFDYYRWKEYEKKYGAQKPAPTTAPTIRR